MGCAYREFRLCLSKTSICVRRWELWELCFFIVLSADADFSCVTPCYSAFDLAFACCLELENLALRHQIGVLQRSARKRPKLILLDRLLWAALSRVWSEWRSALAIVQPETVVAWHRRGFRLFWAWKIRRGQPGRPTLPREVRDLIRRMCRENPTWGAPRIRGELLKLGINVGESSVSKYVMRNRSRSRRLGVPFWTIMPSSWSPSISSPCLRFASKCFTCFWS